MSNENQSIMFNSEQEYQNYLDFLADKTAKETKERAKGERESYKQLVDEQINMMFPELLKVSENLREKKASCLDAFKKALELKAGIFGVKDEQQSHTFTNTENNRRIVIGYYVTDNYRDTVEDGIAIVREVICSLAKDAESKALVNAVMRLLSRDKQGNLKASRVLQLRKTSDELNNDRFAEGVKIIEEAYQPAFSKQFVRAEYKNEKGIWINVPLGMTEA